MEAFCDTCHDITEFTVAQQTKEKTIHGKTVAYNGKEAYCKLCHQLVFVSDIRDYNLEKLEEAYENSK